MPRRARSVIFGWGDLRWYAEGHNGVGSALRALLPSRSVLWVAACRHRPEHCLGPHTHWRALPLRPGGRKGLDRFLIRALALTPAGRPRPFGPRSSSSEFYRARAPYDAFHTCNTWTAEALEAARIPVTSVGVLFSVQLWSELPRPRCVPPPQPSPPPTRSGLTPPVDREG